MIIYNQNIQKFNKREVKIMENGNNGNNFSKQNYDNHQPPEVPYQQPPVDPNTVQAPKQNKNNTGLKIGLIVLGIVIVLLIVAIVLILVFNNRPAAPETTTTAITETSPATEPATETTAEAATEAETVPETTQAPPPSQNYTPAAQQQPEYPVVPPVIQDPMRMFAGNNISYYKVSTNGYALYVRTGPGKDYKAVRKLYDGEVISVLGFYNGWAYVEQDFGYGGPYANYGVDVYNWVSADYIEYY